MLVPDYEVVLKEIEDQAEEKNWPIVGREKGRVLIDVCHEHNPRRVLELGALVGYSSTMIAANLDETGKVVSIEISPENAELCRANQIRAGMADRCEVIVGDALEVIPTLEGAFDMLFIDAVKEDYLRYLQLVEPKLTANAVVVADNVLRFADAVRPYLDYVRNSGKYDSTYHEFGDDAVEVSIRRQA
jgi:predicted O-methyltransferase YrrM